MPLCSPNVFLTNTPNVSSLFPTRKERGHCPVSYPPRSPDADNAADAINTADAVVVVDVARTADTADVAHATDAAWMTPTAKELTRSPSLRLYFYG